MELDQALRIAVIGGGISGIAAAHVLQQKHRVTLYEQNDYVGGHTRTVVIDRGPDAGLPVDTGFIVLNDRTYPNLLQFFEQLEVAIDKTDMAFSYWDRGAGFCYAGTNLRGLFAQPGNLLDPAFWKLLAGIGRFLPTTRKRLRQGRLPGRSLSQYLQQEHFSREVIHNFVLPMAAAIWSTPTERVAHFPAEAFARFYDHHGLLAFTQRPTWYFVKGGSHSYVKAFLRRFTGEVLCRRPVSSVTRGADGVSVIDSDGESRHYDAVVIATHADQALAILADPSAEEQELLSRWQYNQNQTVLHGDDRYLPPRKAARAAWNFIREPGDRGPRELTVTYFMNRLQALATPRPYCVTLNPPISRPPRNPVMTFADTHPIYSAASMATQRLLPSLNGRRRTYFCGAYFGYGFHEDGIRSALDVVAHFGLKL